MSDLADVVMAEARLRQYRAALHLCPAHQPDRWEDDGTCPICEGQRLKARDTALRARLAILEQEWRERGDDKDAIGERQEIHFCADAIRALLQETP